MPRLEFEPAFRWLEADVRITKPPVTSFNYITIATLHSYCVFKTPITPLIWI